MLAFRKWFYKPKKSDSHLLAQFYYADEDLNCVSQELDSFDGRQDPDRCTVLVNQLRMCQDKVLGIIEQLMRDAIPDCRASRDFRAKFPDDVLQDSLAGQLWFGAECLAAGSTIMNREIESAALRPLARCLTRNLDSLRNILKDQSYKNINSCPQKVKEALKKFDCVFAEFELSYVSAMVPVKSALEYDTMQDVIVLFCETINRALSKKLLTQDQIDDYDPGLMFTIPRLAIISGLVVFPDGPLDVTKPMTEISELFRPFQNLLIKIKELLETLTEDELQLLERALCSSEESWEDIERELDMLSSRDRRSIRRDSRMHDEVKCGLSPCSSCITDCETVCSSILSLTPDDCHSSFNGSVRRKVSNAYSVTSADDGINYLDIPGAVDSSVSRLEQTNTGIRIKRCPHRIESLASPQMSPDSLDDVGAGSRECHRRRCSSAHHSDAGLEDSGQFQDARLSSRSVDSSPRFTKRTSCDCSSTRERTISDVTSLIPAEHSMPGEDKAFRRVDSGLGSAPNEGLMELYIQELQTQYQSDNCNNDSHEQSLPEMAPSKPLAKTDVRTLLPEGNTLSIEMQDSKLKVALDDPVPCKCGKQDRVPSITTDLGANFPHFGKGKPSTELNTAGSVGNSSQSAVAHRFSSSSRHPHFITRHSESSIPVQTPSSASTDPSRTHVAVRSSQSDPTFRLPFLSIDSNLQSLHSGDNIPSALNLVTGSTGIVRSQMASGSDDESSELSSSPSLSSCCSSCCTSSHLSRDFKWESDDSSDTNSILSESNDEQEITMAIQAAELAARQQVRSQFSSSSDLVHRLFVCIAGVADQLQTNFASDLRSILKTVFEVTVCNPIDTDETLFNSRPATPTSSDVASRVVTSSRQSRSNQVADQISNIHTSSGMGDTATTSSNENTAQLSNSTTVSENVPETVNSSSNGHSGNKYNGSHNNNHSHGGNHSGNHKHNHRTSKNETREGVNTEGRDRHRHQSNSSHRSRQSNYVDPPAWVPDDSIEECLSCRSSFTVLRRKHHCRNCGQIFCARCSANSVPLPRFGQMKPVRVCNRCYMFQVTPFQH